MESEIIRSERRRVGVRPMMAGAAIVLAAGIAAVAWTPASATPTTLAAPMVSPTLRTGDRIAYGWGEDHSGQIGDGNAQPTDPNTANDFESIPSPVAGRAPFVVQIVGGANFSVALRTDGSVWVWGTETVGELADGKRENRQLAPVRVAGLTGIAEVAASGFSAYAVGTDGSVWGWGDNALGQLGAPAGGERDTPVRIAGATGIAHISAGFGFAVALRSNGEVWTWGTNANGQLGDGTTTARATPARAATPYGIAGISAGAQHVLAVRNDGSLWGWGYDGDGELGDGVTSLSNPTPRINRRVAGVVEVAAGRDHSLALAGDGTVWAWGSNAEGAIGDGSVTRRLAPVHLGLAGVSHIASGAANSAAVRTDGTLWIWGDNGYGQLGNGSGLPQVPRSTVPSQVPGLISVTQATFGDFTVHAVAEPPPTVPNLLGQTQASALATLASVNLVGRAFNQADDNSCNHLHLVVNQIPATGTAVPLGSTVSVYVAVQPAGGCF